MNNKKLITIKIKVIIHLRIKPIVKLIKFKLLRIWNSKIKMISANNILFKIKIRKLYHYMKYPCVIEIKIIYNKFKYLYKIKISLVFQNKSLFKIKKNNAKNNKIRIFKI